MRNLIYGFLAVSTRLSSTVAVWNFSSTSTTRHNDDSFKSGKLGDYIAAGLGFASTREPTTSSNTSLVSSFTNGSFPSSVHHANITASGGNTVITASTSYFSSCQASTTNSRDQVYADCEYFTTNVTKTFTNTTWAPATNADDCWTQWESYYLMHAPSPATISVISYAVPETIETTPYVYTEGSYITDRTTTTTITSTLPTVADNGGFTHTMSQVIVTYVTELTAFLSASTTSTSMYTRTYTPWSQKYTLISASNDANWPAPSCTLPAIYPACQSQWEEYATHNIAPNPQPLAANCNFNLLNLSQSAPACYINGQSSWEKWRSYISEATSPVCSQASITGALCTSLKDAYVLGHNGNLAPDLPEPASFSSGYYSNVAPWFTGWTWPATQAFAPGCTLDCGRCAVTGGTIQLLYFPPGLSHPTTEPVVATTLGTVLTSPTYYIAFESLYASDACSGVGSTLTSMILPIPTEEPLSTLFATTIPCDAHRLNNAWLGMVDIGTAALNVTDLMQDPVPYSIYTSQPYCASQMVESGCRPDSCPTTLPYRPLIVLSSELLNTLDPAWATCSLDLRGLYDPPRALQLATAIVLPTVPGASPTTSATPANGPATTTPEPTPLPQQEDPKPAQTPTTSRFPHPPAHDSPALPTNSPAPVVNQPGPQPISADPGGVLVSLISVIVETSRNAGSHHDSAGDHGSPVSDTLTIHASAQHSQTLPTDALGALTAPLANPAAQDGTSEASALPTENGDHSQPEPWHAADPDQSHVAATSQASPDVVVNGQTIRPAQLTVVDGISLSAASDAMVVDGTTVPIGVMPLTTTLGSQTITLRAGNSIAIDPSKPEETAKDRPIIFAAGSQTFTAIPGQPLVIGGSTVSRNVAVIVNGHTYSSGSAGLIVDGTPVTALPGSVSQASGAIVIDGKTLTLGGSAATIDGTVVSAGSTGLVLGGAQTVAMTNAGSASQAIVTIGGKKLTAILPSESESASTADGDTSPSDGSTVSEDGAKTSTGTIGISSTDSRQSNGQRAFEARCVSLYFALAFCVICDIILF